MGMAKFLSPSWVSISKGVRRSFIRSFNRSDGWISYAIVVFDWFFSSTPVPVVLSQIHTQARIGCIHPVYFYEQVNVLSVHLAAAAETKRQEQCDRTTRTTTSTGTTIDGANLCPASCKFWSEHLGCDYSAFFPLFMLRRGSVVCSHACQCASVCDVCE